MAELLITKIGSECYRFLWLHVVDRVRTAVEEYEGYISIPKLTEAEMVY